MLHYWMLCTFFFMSLLHLRLSLDPAVKWLEKQASEVLPWKSLLQIRFILISANHFARYARIFQGVICFVYLTGSYWLKFGALAR